MAATLTDFEKQDYVERERFGYGFKSEITLSDEQREAIVSLVTTIDKFKNGDRQTIEEGRRFAQRVASDPKLFSDLMLKAKEHSPYVNKTDREDMRSYFLSILRQHPISTVNQIHKFLKEDYDKRLTSFGIRRNLSVFVREGEIVFERTKSGNVYRVVRI